MPHGHENCDSQTIKPLQYSFCGVCEFFILFLKTLHTTTRYAYRSCLDFETQAMKLPVHIVCADVHFRGSLELCSYLVSKALTTFMHPVPSDPGV